MYISHGLVMTCVDGSPHAVQHSSLQLCRNKSLCKRRDFRRPYSPSKVRRTPVPPRAFHIEGMLRAHFTPFPLTTTPLLVVEKDLQPPFWSPIPSFGVLLFQPAPSGARLHHFYLSSFFSRRYFLVPGVIGIPHRQRSVSAFFTILHLRLDLVDSAILGDCSQRIIASS
jgi:hypothetical protein